MKREQRRSLQDETKAWWHDSEQWAVVGMPGPWGPKGIQAQPLIVQMEREAQRWVRLSSEHGQESPSLLSPLQVPQEWE